MVVGKRFILFLFGMATLFAGAWYLLQPQPVVVENRQEATPPTKQPAAETASEPAPVASIIIPGNVPPFHITLPKPLSDADILRGIAASYRSGTVDRITLAIAKGMLEDSAARRATAEWMAAQAGMPLRFEWFSTFQAQYPDWPMTVMLRRRAETALLTSPVSDTVKSQFLTANPPLSVAGKLAFARLLASSGSGEKAAEIIRPLWRQEPMSKNAEQQIVTAFGAALTPTDHRSRMALLLSKQNWDAALRAADAAGSNATQIAKARIAVVQNSKKAEAALAAIPRPQQSDPLVAYSRLLLLTQQKKYREAGATAQGTSEGEKTERRPASLIAAECQDWKAQQRRVIRELLDANDTAAAYRAASARLSDVGCIHDDAQFLAGWIALRFLKQPEKAMGHFDTLAAQATGASTRSRSAYWQGRVTEEQNGPDAAKPYYERAAAEWTTFYGQLAREKLPGGPLPVFKTVEVPPDIRASFDNLMAVRAIRLLHEGGADDLRPAAL